MGIFSNAEIFQIFMRHNPATATSAHQCQVHVHQGCSKQLNKYWCGEIVRGGSGGRPPGIFLKIGPKRPYFNATE